MISSTLLFALAAGATRAALVPTAPGPGQSFNEGADCTMSWNLDTTGKWTNFSVDLMSGSNQVMQTVTNVFKGRDGTKGDTTFSWKCPQVTPNSAIYFYQFTQDGADTTWTTRFTIASASGEVTPPANSVQPGGAAIPWGIGRLEGAGASPSNTTAVETSTGTNRTSNTNVTTPIVTGNTTNATAATTAAGVTSTVALNGTTGITGPPKQATSPASTATTTPAKTGPASSNTASTSKTNTTASPSSSDATSLVSSEVAMAALAVVTLFIAT